MRRSDIASMGVHEYLPAHLGVLQNAAGVSGSGWVAVGRGEDLMIAVGAD